jgi:ABC-type transport system involved in cytochrome bd biosynthesis fused ATPase/permease subunit
VEYLSLPQEPAAIIESNRPPAYWPSSTSNNSLISVEDLVIKYAPELPAVLHGVSFELKAKERIGLLGRTGSGKLTDSGIVTSHGMVLTKVLNCDR